MSKPVSLVLFLAAAEIAQ